MSLDALVSFVQTTDGASSNLISRNDLQMIWTHRQSLKKFTAPQWLYIRPIVYESSRYQWVVISALPLITKEKWIKHYTVYNFSRVTHFWGFFGGNYRGHFWGKLLGKLIWDNSGDNLGDNKGNNLGEDFDDNCEDNCFKKFVDNDIKTRETFRISGPMFIYFFN